MLLLSPYNFLFYFKRKLNKLTTFKITITKYQSFISQYKKVTFTINLILVSRYVMIRVQKTQISDQVYLN